MCWSFAWTQHKNQSIKEKNAPQKLMFNVLPSKVATRRQSAGTVARLPPSMSRDGAKVKLLEKKQMLLEN